MTLTADELAAYADGELSGEQEALVAAAIAADPVLAKQLKAHLTLKTKLGQNFAPILEEPVPDGMAAAIRQSAKGEVVDFAAARARREARFHIPRWSYVAAPAIAAVLALALFLPRGGGEGPAYADAQLAAILDQRLIADQSPAAPTRILISFQDKDGSFCRVFSGAETGGGIACREEGGWKLTALGEGQAGAQTPYRMAGQDNAELLARAQQMAAGPALDADAEAAARKRGWR